MVPALEFQAARHHRKVMNLNEYHQYRWQNNTRSKVVLFLLHKSNMCLHAFLPIKYHFWRDCSSSTSFFSILLHCVPFPTWWWFVFLSQYFTICVMIWHTKNFKEQFNSKSFYGGFPNRIDLNRYQNTTLNIVCMNWTKWRKKMNWYEEKIHCSEQKGSTVSTSSNVESFAPTREFWLVSQAFQP